MEFQARKKNEKAETNRSLTANSQARYFSIKFNSTRMRCRCLLMKQ